MLPIEGVLPKQLKVVLEVCGYDVILESPSHWILQRGNGTPLPIPKEGGSDGLLSVEITQHALFDAQLSYYKYVELAEKMSDKWG